MSVARTAPFVFFGTVRRPDGSNVELLESDEYPTAVVRVDDVVTAPEAVGDLSGREITVHLSQPGRLSRGSRHLFMATSLHFGEEIAVAEIARVPHRPRRWSSASIWLRPSSTASSSASSQWSNRRDRARPWGRGCRASASPSSAPGGRSRAAQTRSRG
jgi:hypothetical protein